MLEGFIKTGMRFKGYPVYLGPKGEGWWGVPHQRDADHFDKKMQELVDAHWELTVGQKHERMLKILAGKDPDA